MLPLVEVLFSRGARKFFLAISGSRIFSFEILCHQYEFLARLGRFISRRSVRTWKNPRIQNSKSQNNFKKAKLFLKKYGENSIWGNLWTKMHSKKNSRAKNSYYKKNFANIPGAENSHKKILAPKIQTIKFYPRQNG